MNQDQVAVKTPEFVSLNFKLAGLGSRAGAMIIDQLLLLIGNIVILLVFYFMADATLDIGQVMYLVALIIISVFVLRWGYFWVSEYFFSGRTVGKKVVGIRVIQENGHRITLLSSIIRNLLRIIDTLPTAYLIGIIMVFFHKQHKRLGDIMAGTIVIYERETKKKKTPLEKVIESRGITESDVPFDISAIKSLGMKEWKLLKTYSERLPQLDAIDRIEPTKRVAAILLPKVDVHPENKTSPELEDILLVLYLYMKDEWEYEL